MGEKVVFSKKVLGEMSQKQLLNRAINQNLQFILEITTWYKRYSRIWLV